MKKHTPSEFETELRELAGSPEAYERLLDNLQAQMAEVARRRGKMDLTVDILAPVPARSTRRRAAASK
jgi:prefoldin subunit 5